MKDVPIEFQKDLEKAKRDREFASTMLKHYTDQWLKAHLKYTSMLDFIEVKMGQKK
jgi:hypothetical protein